MNPRGEPRKPAVICDMDGTLVDVREIRHLVEKSPRRDFNGFHAASIDCPANEAVRRLLRVRKAAGEAIIIVTARESQWSFLTSLWLRENEVEYDQMLMRTSRDHRPDHVIKDEFATLLGHRYDVQLAVDDRDDILSVWKRHGFPTLKVASDGSIGNWKA